MNPKFGAAVLGRGGSDVVLFLLVVVVESCSGSHGGRHQQETRFADILVIVGPIDRSDFGTILFILGKLLGDVPNDQFAFLKTSWRERKSKK